MWPVITATIVIHLLLLNRAHLREGTKVLLDPLDYDDFNDILAGKEVEASKCE